MKDFNLHKYWAMRLVGYLQMISGQRFWTIVLLVCQHTGVFRKMEHPFYPQLEEDSPQSLVDSVVVRMFHDTFIIAWEHPFYPQLEEDSPQSLVDSVVVRMFHDTFIIAWFFAFVGTELYLAAAKKDNAFGDKVQDGRNAKVGYEKIPTKSFISYQSTDQSD
eukprot:CAMPEP_0204641524 /NCGR_PEP_ID=MMETSP0717-20131115/51180_1 /ASSEMBLY_ACC=CAM_ASM_000666 /TAXON_ID=230516 /ORGANISM="Chaetoceros curvisetus" /LENGTH=161 /DNA_ID=CAMNT_0051662195 /DNA_START=552 /DNA_END=1037 /DNA_ORIENTATION=-